MTDASGSSGFRWHMISPSLVSDFTLDPHLRDLLGCHRTSETSASCLSVRFSALD